MFQASTTEVWPVTRDIYWGSSDLNQFLKNCPKMLCAVFTGCSSWSKTLSASSNWGYLDDFLRYRLLKMAKITIIIIIVWSNSPHLSAHASDTHFWVISLFYATFHICENFGPKLGKEVMDAQSTSFRATLTITLSYLNNNPLVSTSCVGQC